MPYTFQGVVSVRGTVTTEGWFDYPSGVFFLCHLFSLLKMELKLELVHQLGERGVGLVQRTVLVCCGEKRDTFKSKADNLLVNLHPFPQMWS